VFDEVIYTAISSMKTSAILLGWRRSQLQGIIFVCRRRFCESDYWQAQYRGVYGCALSPYSRAL